MFRGRAFTEQDREGSTLVVIVNQSFDKQFFPGQPAIGRHIKFGSVGNGPWYEIVGIVGNVRQEHLRSADSPNIYVPYRQFLRENMFLILKSSRSGLASGLAGAKLVQALDHDQPVDDVVTMETRMADSISADRANMTLMGIFASIALALAAIGIFGVLAYFVSCRSHEIGIRIALGAQRGDVLRVVLGPGLAMTAAGCAIGLVGAIGSMRVLRTSLYGISSNDPLTLVGVVPGFSLVALVACYIPALRATKVSPSEVLRCE